MKKIKVLIWNEFRHEKENESVSSIYPEGIHNCIGDFLRKSNQTSSCQFSVSTAILDEPENGLSEKRLNGTDTLIWWGHCAHDEVDDIIVKRVHKRVLEGMGLIVLHSGHFSKIFRSLLGTNCSLKWREAAEKERLWNLAPNHPITEGIGEYLEIANAEMYGERFDIPNPDELLFISWFEGGEVFRSGCTWKRGHGKIFYFRPGHETYPIFHQSKIQRVITNAVKWTAQIKRIEDICPNVAPLEKLSEKNVTFGKAGIQQQSGKNI
jgi:trehalose utilization protein